MTQVLPALERPLVHNRLTHTLKVEQVGRRMAQYLVQVSDHGAVVAGGVDPDVVAVAAAAHDLGHPPFGHIAEDELQNLLATEGFWLRDSFEGNAQSLRLVAKLAVRKASDEKGRYESADGYGLDLTRASLAALSKYPWCKGEHASRGHENDSPYYSRKWSAYDSERDLLDDFILAELPSGRSRSIEADIMDLADDITYALHDIEDFFRVGLIPLNEIALACSPGSYSSTVFDDFWAYAIAEIQDKGEAPFDPHVARIQLQTLAPLMPDSPFEDKEADRLALHRFISETVSKVQESTRINSEGELIIEPANRMLIEVLKQLTWYFVIGHPALARAQRGQRRVIRELVEWLASWVAEFEPAPEAKRAKRLRRRKRQLPARLQSYLDFAERDRHNMRTRAYSETEARRRAIVDYVTGLTEVEAYELHRRLGGTDSGSIVTGMLGR